MAASFPTKINWHLSAMPKTTKKALDFLATQSWLKTNHWYLAGGTALALQTGHRVSVDLDFFTTQTDFNSGLLINHFKNTDWQTNILDRATIYGELFGAKISFIAYPFFIPVEPPLWYNNVRVLAAKDIAVMKIIAISQRGRKRDFFDLYWYVKNHEPLIDIICRLKIQYPTVAHDYHHIVKSLVYFDDAETDPNPRLLFRATWNQVKLFFKKEISRVGKDLLQLN